MLKTVFLLITTICITLWATVIARPLNSPLSIKAPTRDTFTGVVNPSALDSFFGRLAATEKDTSRRPVRIMQFGDSHTKGGLFTGAAQLALQRELAIGSSLSVRDASYVRDTSRNPSIIYQAIGKNGARLTRLRDMTQTSVFLRGVAQNMPDLIVIAYGTNEVTDRDWTLASYEGMLVGIITRIRSAVPGASVLVIGPPDRSVAGSGGWESVRRIELLLEAQRSAAVRAGAAFWSEYDAMGGPGSMNEWVVRGLGQRDHVHCTVAGYSRLGALLAADLIDAYRRWPSEYPDPLNGLDLRVMRGVPLSSKNR